MDATTRITNDGIIRLITTTMEMMELLFCALLFLQTKSNSIFLQQFVKLYHTTSGAINDLLYVKVDQSLNSEGRNDLLSVFPFAPRGRL